MSSRIPLQSISNTIPDYSYEPYYDCCYYDNQLVGMESSYDTFYINSNSLPFVTQSASIDCKKKSARRSKHIPHHLRPQHLVEKRNRRERLRVQDVNQAFCTLQQLLPIDSKATTCYDNDQQINLTQNSTRISKVRTLRKAVDYIEALQRMLDENH